MFISSIVLWKKSLSVHVVVPVLKNTAVWLRNFQKY